MQIVSSGDNLHEMLNLFSGKNKKNISICCLLKILLELISKLTILQKHSHFQNQILHHASLDKQNEGQITQWHHSEA